MARQTSLRALPARPSLEYLKKLAKKQLAALRKSDPKAKLTSAQLVVAREHGFKSWRALQAHVSRLEKKAPALKLPRSATARYKLLADAIGAGDADRVALILDHAPNLIGAVDRQRTTPLHVAADAGQVVIIRLLLDRGADPHARASWDGTPLVSALIQGHTDAAEALAEHGVEPDVLHVRAGLGRINKLPRDATQADLDHALEYAARSGRIKTATMLLQRGANIHARGFFGATPLHWAACTGKLDMVQHLIEQGADPLIKDPTYGGDALGWACEFKREDVAQWLMQHTGQTPRRKPAPKKKSKIKLDARKLKQLSVACLRGEIKIVRQLLKQEPALATAWKPIMDASYKGHANIVEVLLQAGADPDVVSGTAHRYRPLHRAMEPKITEPRGPEHEKVVKVLLDAGADPALRGTLNNVTALQLAATGEPRFVPMLIDRLKPLNIWDAAVCLDERRIKTLISKTPSLVWAKDESGWRALHYCAASALYRQGAKHAKAQLRIANLLIDNGADVNAIYGWQENEDEWPISVLYHACGQHDNPALTELLLERGAIMYDGESVYHASDEDHRACLDVLERYTDPKKLAIEASMCLRGQLQWGRTRGMKWLLAHGADPNAPDEKTGDTALHKAAHSGASEKVIRSLLDHGASAERTNSAGKTPIDVARDGGKARVVEQLKAARLSGF